MPTNNLSDDRLEILHEQISLAARSKKNTDEPVWITVNAKEIASALNELRRRRNFGKLGTNRISHITKALMSLQVYESFDMEPMAHSSLATLKKTARKHMANDQARWNSQTLNNGLIRITRQPDGSPARYNRERNPLILVLGRMRVGEEVLIDKTTTRTVHDPLKVQIRRKFDNPSMNWKTTNLANGKVRVRRVR